MICISICYAMQHGIDVVNKVYSKESVLFTFLSSMSCRCKPIPFSMFCRISGEKFAYFNSSKKGLKKYYVILGKVLRDTL